MKEPLIMLTSWGGAQYIDWWLAVHFLAGLGLGYLLRIFGFTFIHSFIIVTLVLVGWEVCEWMAKIPEPWTNSLLDMMAGFIGIWTAYRLILLDSLRENIALSLLILVVWSGSGIWGWNAWKEREIQREKLAATNR